MPWPRTGLYKTTPRGVRVFLRKNTWFNHICTSHPELKNWLDDILSTIEKPEGIYDDRGTLFSFRFSEKRGKYIMLVYRIVGRMGRIKTAYTVNDPFAQTRDLNKVWPR